MSVRFRIRISESDEFNFDHSQRFLRSDIASELYLLAEDVITAQAPKLNELLGVNFSTNFWKRFLQYWLVGFVDALFIEFINLESKCRTREDAGLCEMAPFQIGRATRQMQDFLEVSQNPAWRSHLRRDIQNVIMGEQLIGLDVVRRGQGLSNRQQDQPIRKRLKVVLGRFTRQRRVVLVTTYLPIWREIVLSIRLRTLPTWWLEPTFVLWKYSAAMRQNLADRQLSKSPYCLEEIVHSLIPYYLPLSTIEGFADLLNHCQSNQHRSPNLVFTANKHFASDSFALWLALMGERGTTIAISQHGGLNGQGFIATRDEQVEQNIADLYLHWGWSDSSRAVRIPAQIGFARRRSRLPRSTSGIVLVTDTTFRFERRFWNDSEIYRDHIFRTFRSIPSNLKRETIVRLHRDHDRYDESHSVLWNKKFPEANLDPGHCRMRLLTKNAKLVICTTLGTTEIESFLRGTPVILSLNRSLHQPRIEFKPLLEVFGLVGLAHFSGDSLNRFLVEKFEDLNGWWTSQEVQDAISQYLQSFAHQSKRSTCEYKKVLTGGIRNFSN